jgi:hypothetical protein
MFTAAACLPLHMLLLRTGGPRLGAAAKPVSAARDVSDVRPAQAEPGATSGVA